MIISRTPLRVSLFGGGTDFRGYYEQHEGAVVSMAIDKFVHIIVKPNTFDHRIILNHFEKEVVDHVSQIQHPLIRESLKFAGIENGIEIMSMIDVPLRGTGLGSSSSFTVGLLNALFAFQGKEADPEELAEMASTIEIDIVGSPIGKQDQYAAAFGGLREYLFKRSGTVSVSKIPIERAACEALASKMLLFYTGIQREASSVLTDQKKNIDVNIAHLDALKAIALESKKAFVEQQESRIGELLNMNWEYKKRLSDKVENAVINDIYHLGMQNGAYGGKVLGAGGGGFVCFICKEENQKSLKGALKGFHELPIAFESLGTRVYRL